jgi:hypothetical protein
LPASGAATTPERNLSVTDAMLVLG